MQNTGPDLSEIIQVAVGIVLNEKDQVLISQRANNVHQANKWEFPGGKIERNETANNALRRELAEELGIHSLKQHFLSRINFDYGDKKVCLNNFIVTSFSGIPESLEGQPFKWVNKSELKPEDFPLANRIIINQLQLPERIQISGGFSTYEQLEMKVHLCIKQGIKLVHFRAHELDDQTYLYFAAKLAAYCQLHKVKLVVNRTVDVFNQLNVDGLHLSHRLASKFTRRPISTGKLFSVSCHNENELLQANKLGADYVFLSPVKNAISHNAGQPLGFNMFKQLIPNADCPVFALGGMSAKDLNEIKLLGAAGIAMISELWK